MTIDLVSFVLEFVHQYGFVAVFVYMVLETSFLLHFVPSEVVLPFAASQLVHDPASFVLFVADATVGATVGSLLAYFLFGRNGRTVLERYGSVVHVSPERLDRSQAIFVQYGESSVFWGRMVPFLRALISIPAGLAAMNLRRFVAYSAGGALVFNTGLTYLVYTGAGTRSPLALVLQHGRTAILRELAYVRTHAAFVVVLVGVAAVVALIVWLARDWIRANPEWATLVGLHLVRLVGLTVAGLFLFGALSSPHRAFAAITWAWDDPRVFVRLGFSERVALALTAGLIAVSALAVYEVGQVVRLSHLQTIGSRVRGWFRREE